MKKRHTLIILLLLLITGCSLTAQQPDTAASESHSNVEAGSTEHSDVEDSGQHSSPLEGESSQHSSPAEDDSTQTDSSAQQANQQPGEGGLYQNDAGYSLTIPSDWAGKYRIETRHQVTYFLYHAEDPQVWQQLFHIRVLPAAEWEKEKDGPNPGTIITTHGDQVYLYGRPLDMGLEGEEARDYSALSEQIPQIIESFQLTAK
ncbi:hypothetical protein LOK74_14235 [Brevibacillus humidisoli]|uniref:hypothetical protein n=1 Tax=Brevibacillus humidisoli TaxID=2895522 RepID=UPI001E57CA4A|nr:hypothetical protein [Brevibacillus humidisoli]UFJ39228.1 hypothetical protein LOK74_14235 [Brevibacillus humidisoli]